MANILIVDDDRETCRFMMELLDRPGRHIEYGCDAATVLSLARSKPFDLLISDLNLNAEVTGLDVLRVFKETNPQAQVLLISGFGTLETAIEASRAGAFDYISKPFDIGEVKATVDRALAQARVPNPESPARREIRPAGLLGRSGPMLAVYKQIAHAADSVVPVLITGESGTGKELVARAIHQHSARSNRPFVAVNCGAIAETLLESELFGHTRGAFTGAVADTKGLFEQAHGGTVFLDEIAETSPNLQVKLLRVLQEGEVRPVGASRTARADARVIAASNVDLGQAVARQRFRQDLYYRLGVVEIHTPALRERPEDIPLLVDQFLQNACTRARRQVELSPAALDALVRHRWPGNVRELENAIERLVLFCRGSIIETADLPSPLQSQTPDPRQALFQDLPSLDELARRYLLHVIEAVGRNRSRAAAVMGIDRRTLYRMAERFGIDLSEPTDDS
jgi:DNA-binding NtrC family response regulator